MEIIKVSKKEFEKGQVIKNILDRKISKQEGRIKLNLSIRQIYRLCKRFKKLEIQSLVHKNRDKASNRKISSRIRLKKLELIRNHYSDFGPQLIKEHPLSGFQRTIGPLVGIGAKPQFSTNLQNLFTDFKRKSDIMN